MYTGLSLQRRVKLLDELPGRPLLVMLERGEEDHLTVIRQLDRSPSVVQRRWTLAVVLGYWAAALRPLILGTARMRGMSLGRFLRPNVTDGALWANAVTAAGYAARASCRVLAHRLSDGGEVVTTVAVLAVAVWVVRAQRAGRVGNNSGP